MLNKENYVSWSSRLLRYAKSRPNGKLFYNSIMNGPYVRRMIAEPGVPARIVPVPETFHEQTDDELTEAEIKQMEADDQAIQTILLGLPEDIYAAVDSCETAQEIWFSSTDGESIESYYHRFSILINDFKRNKHFPEKIANNLKFLNNLQPEWSRHVTIVHQAKDLHTIDYTQLYDFLKYNQKENYMQQPMSNPEDIRDPTAAMNMALTLMTKIAQLGNQVVQNSGVQNVGNQNRVIVVPGIANKNGNGDVVAARAEGNSNGNNGNHIRCYNCRGLVHLTRNCTVRPRRMDAAYLQTQLLIAQKEEVGIQLQAKEFDLMAATTDLDEIKEVNANCILMANLSAEVQLHENCYNDEIFNMFTQEEQYTELLEPIPEPHQVPQNDSNVISEVSSVEQGGGTVEQHSVNVEETKVAKFVRDFQSLANEANESLAKHKALELEVERLLRAVVNQDIMSIVQNNWVVDTSNLQTELERTKERFENCIIKKENEYAKLWNDWYKKCEECKYDKISYDKAYNDMQQKIERLQAQLGDQKVDITTKTRRPQPRSNTKNDRVPSVSKSSCIKNKEVKVEDHPRNLVLTKNKKHMSSECNNIKLAIWNDKSEIVCAMCKQCLSIANHDACVLNYVNGMNSHSKKQKANVSNIENQTKHKAQIWKPKNVGPKERLASPKPSQPRMRLRWSPTGKMFDIKGKIIASSESNGDNACTPNAQEPKIKRFPNSTSFLGRVYFIEGLGHNLFSVGQFYDSDLEVAFRRNTCFVRNLEGVDLLKGNRSTNLYTINLHDMACASPICLMAQATSTKSWLWHQRLSHLNIDIINNLGRNDLVTGLPKFKYHKEHLCSSCEKGKSKRASHPPKPVPNSKQRSKDEAPEEIKTFLKKITVLLQAPVIIVRTDNGTEFKNQVLQEYFKSVGISHQASSVPIATACYTQNRSIIYRRFNKTPYELINGRKLDISFLYVFGALCYPRNDREDIGKVGAKGELDLLFEAMHDDHIGGQPSAALRTVLAAQAPQVL
ncbi:retrovirus-related pol polyprotein from transposon TNT 1-94 [Tanacetum coccineum]